ncbi:hypothetical protein ACWT_7957 [Actinoplanes sp. SE50]|uniref:hypothetical protein n=1 Tax=unclassified Actinoplanes TaxID=2626549 RepID=UPI00023EE040|nr:MULTISPECIES: hypothetical protein [unclassified Actinoplanes]AEV88966.1 hypothetical protein ACPL_8088 [Actinoplanes sp. SE50/110]ATO87372.1 hypothetical protein ACWT_7957 [Actinoplanes sp. SE50]SLM04790.1 hypothetical protein ACSP50_8098 [Actinoplanes sp. SE50/110]
MASVEEIKMNIAVSVSGADRAIAGIQMAGDQLDQSLAMLRLTTVGSFHPAATAAIAHLEQARARLDEATQLTRAAMDSANQFRGGI